MCMMCLDIECKKTSCKDIKCKRYFLPLIFTPAAAWHPEVFNFYYFHFAANRRVFSNSSRSSLLNFDSVKVVYRKTIQVIDTNFSIT